MLVDADQSPNALLLDFAENGANWFARDLHKVLGKIAALLPDTLLLKALEIASELEEGWDRADVVNELAPYLPAYLMPKALDIVGGVYGFGENGADYDDDRVKALIKLAAYVPEHLMPRVLALAYETQGESERVAALTGLIQYFPHILPEVVVLARQISYFDNCIYALMQLLPYVPDLVPEILVAIRDWEGEHREHTQSWSLVALTPYLSDHLLPDAAKIVQGIGDKKYRLKTLTTLVVRLPEFKSEVLALARGIEEEYDRVMAMAYLTVSLPEIGPEVLEVINSIQDNSTKWRSLRNSLEYLPENCISAAIQMTRECQSPGYRFFLLSRLIDHAPQDLLAEIWEMVNEIEDQDLRNRMLKRLADRMSPSEPIISSTEN